MTSSMTRLDGGRVFLVALYATILASWYPLQDTYVAASRGSSVGLAVGIATLAAGVAWGGGRAIDLALAALAGAAGTAAGLSLGAALVVGLAGATPFYTSTLDAGSLAAAITDEYLAAVLGAAIGGLIGALAAKAVFRRPSAGLDRRVGRLALGVSGLAIVLVLGLAVGTIRLVVPVVSRGTTGAVEWLTPDLARAVVFALTVLATASAVLIEVADGRMRLRRQIRRWVLAVVLVAVPSMAAGLYESFVLNPA